MGDDNYTYKPIEVECPVCESRDYSIEDYQEEEEWITMKMYCLQCGSIYQTIYRAIEINLIKRGRAKARIAL